MERFLCNSIVVFVTGDVSCQGLFWGEEMSCILFFQIHKDDSCDIMSSSIKKGIKLIM